MLSMIDTILNYPQWIYLFYYIKLHNTVMSINDVPTVKIVNFLKKFKY